MTYSSLYVVTNSDFKKLYFILLIYIRVSSKIQLLIKVLYNEENDMTEEEIKNHKERDMFGKAQFITWIFTISALFIGDIAYISQGRLIESIVFTVGLVLFLVLGN